MLQERTQYYAEKIRHARLAGNVGSPFRRKVFRPNPSKDLIDYYFRLRPKDRNIEISKGFADHRGAGNHRPIREVLHRIVAAYRASTVAARGAPECFRVQGCRYRDILKSSGVNLASTALPLMGNPAGAASDGSILPIETLRHAYNARQMAELFLPLGAAAEPGAG